MKKMLVMAAVLAGVAAPAVAQAPAAPDQSTNIQSVYRTERTVEVMNSDGSVSETHIVTRYYLFGYE